MSPPSLLRFVMMFFFLADIVAAAPLSSLTELRTPLHGILVAGELLSDTKLDEQQKSYLQTVQACGTSLIEVVSHVLGTFHLTLSGLAVAARADAVATLPPCRLFETLEQHWPCLRWTR